MQPTPLQLPANFHPHNDVLVLVGRGFEAAAQELHEAGFQRVLLVLPPEAEAPGGFPPEQAPKTSVELLECVSSFRPPLPAQVAIRKSTDAWCPLEELQELAQRIEEALRSRRMLQHTIEKNGKDALLQGLRNLPNVARHPSVAALDGAFEGKPCVLVSPGPSLSRNVHLLPELKGKALLITGTHALASFRSVGVDPDVVLAADAGDLARHVRDYDLANVHAFVAAATTQSYNFEQAAPRTFSFAGNGVVDDWIYEGLDENARLRTGGSVACSALSLALRLGCDPIVLVGQDLSFSDGRFYAEENLDGDAAVETAADGTFRVIKKETSDEYGAGRDEDGNVVFMQPRKTTEVPGYHGGTVQTSEAFRAFLFWFDTVCESQTLEGRRIWNCTEGGARIRGAEQLPLAEALAAFRELPPLDASALLDRSVAAFVPEERATRLSEHFRDTLRELERCSELSRQCQAKLPLALKNETGRAQFEVLERRMRDAVQPLQVLPVVAQKEIHAAVLVAQAAQTLEENLRASALLFETFDRAAQFVRKPIEEALEELSTIRA